MRKFLSIAVLSSPFFFAHAQSTPGSPEINGVWKADLQKSKISGPPITSYLTIIEQKTVVVDRRTGEKGPELDETTGISGQHGEERSTLRFLTNGRAAVRPYEGVPTRLVATWEGNTLNLTGEVAGTPHEMIKRTYALSQDGQTLTIDSVTAENGREQRSNIVLTKQPDSAGEPLRQPEQTAEERFKNVKTSLKTVPASEFIDQMHYIAWSLGKDCEFCHVRGHFDSDDKKEKQTARDMIKMVAAIDADNFKGRPEVRCFTCHEQHAHPPAYPPFPDQATNAANGNGPDRPGLGAGSGPQGPQPGNVPPSKPDHQ